MSERVFELQEDRHFVCAIRIVGLAVQNVERFDCEMRSIPINWFVEFWKVTLVSFELFSKSQTSLKSGT